MKTLIYLESIAHPVPLFIELLIYLALMSALDRYLGKDFADLVGLSDFEHSAIKIVLFGLIGLSQVLRGVLVPFSVTLGAMSDAAVDRLGALRREARGLDV